MPIRMNQYRHVRGIPHGGNEDEPETWIGKVLGIDNDMVLLQWLWRREDLLKLKLKLKSEPKPNPRELLMTSSSSQRDWVQKKHVLECLTMSEGSEDARTDYYWTYMFYPDSGQIAGPLVQTKIVEQHSENGN